MSSKTKNKNKSTKFPVARIKKIMQKDEEVGKVAQATPIVISKALELFLNLIIEESHKVTAERGSRKVEAYHLKHAVETTEMLDFLKELVEAVPDPSAGGTIDLEAEATESKKRRGKGRRNTTASNPDDGDDSVPKKRRRKKAAPAAPADQDDEEEVGEGARRAGGKGRGGFRGGGRMVAPNPEMDQDQDEQEDGDAEMNEYDDEEDAPHRSSSRGDNHGGAGSSEDDGWEGDKPFMPHRR